MSDIIVVAGTVDARRIIEELVKLNIKVVATVATQFGGELLDGYTGVEVHQGRLNCEGIAELIKSAGAKCLVDASHPYAREVSVNAMEACGKAGIPYLRYERDEVKRNSEGVISVRTFEEAAKKANEFEGNIFLAIGSNNLDVFVREITDYKERLLVRVLPQSGVLMKCEGIGLTAENIIAVKGPFSEEMNIQVLKHCQASVMVTKDSGEVGGTDEKFKAAERLSIPIILVERPEIRYTNKVSDINAVLKFVRRNIEG